MRNVIDPLTAAQANHAAAPSLDARQPILQTSTLTIIAITMIVNYPDHCILPPPPDLDCGDITARRFRVLAPDPHRFDSNGDGIGCEGR